MRTTPAEDDCREPDGQRGPQLSREVDEKGTPRQPDVRGGDRDAASPVVFQVNDHTLAFYSGRDLTGPSPVRDIPGNVPYGASSPDTNWVEFGSWNLGICNYVIFRADTAIVYDTGNLAATAKSIRHHLESIGVTQFIVVLSHWHLDHIVGNAVFSDSPIVSLKETRETLIRFRAEIEEGRLWGPPSFAVVLPNVTFENRFEIHLEDLHVQFMNVNVHSSDGNIMYVETDKTLFAGDTLEDTVTVIGQPASIAIQIEELNRLRELRSERILPNHGNPNVISQGGYGNGLIAAVEEYDRNLLAKVHEETFLDLPIEEFIPHALASGVVSVIEPYRVVHSRNLRIVQEHWRAR
jgi:cyclase